MKKPILEDLEEIEECEESEEDDNIQATKIKENKVKPEKIDKRKKGANVRTEKQMEAFHKALKIRDENRKNSAIKKQMEEEEYKKQMDEKIVKKAISIKKKQILREKIVEISSDDDIDTEEVKRIIKKKTVNKIIPPSPLQPLYRFV